jgi:adenine/guanine phosphoribosyltransferase-like PRPP-binding protein
MQIAREGPLLPHQFWQEIFSAGSFDESPPAGFRDFYPARLPDGRQLALPIRVLPESEDRQGIASLIINQASFAVQDALAGGLAALLRPLAPEVVVGLPTLGLTLASAVARALGHSRYVPLGTSQKFWYREELSVPLSSVTSPGSGKRLWIDPRMLPLLDGRRVALVDDVISTGSSMSSALALLEQTGIRPVSLGTAMLQTRRFEATLPSAWRAVTFGVICSPLLARNESGVWEAVEG